MDFRALALALRPNFVAQTANSPTEENRFPIFVHSIWYVTVVCSLYFVGWVCGVTQLDNIAYIVYARSSIIKTFRADALMGVPIKSLS